MRFHSFRHTAHPYIPADFDDIFHQHTADLIVRQISYQITDTLQSAFPEATWEFAEPLRLSHLLDGDAVRLSTRNTGDYNFAEVSMDEYGNLHLQMLTVSALKRRGDKSASPDTPKVDPASWYSLIGKPFLVE